MMNTVLEIESTKAKARFASLPRQAKVGDVAITRHGHIQAYVLSPERYAHLSAIDHTGDEIMQKLEADFETLVARMQSASHADVTEKLAAEPLDVILADVKAGKSRNTTRKGKKRT